MNRTPEAVQLSENSFGEPSSSLRQVEEEAAGFAVSTEMSKAFSDGTLLPYFLSFLSTLPATTDGERGTTSWNGHLPLDPVPAHPDEPHVQWAMPRSRRIRTARQEERECVQSPHTIFPTTLSDDPHHVEILFHSNTVCFFFLFPFSGIA